MAEVNERWERQFDSTDSFLKKANNTQQGKKENVKDQKSENKVLVEGNIDENEKRNSVLDKSDRNSKEPKDNKLHELKSENTLEEKERENVKDQKSENKVLVEGNIDENEKRNSVLDKSDRNSKEPKDNKLHELKSENTLEEKERENVKDQKSENKVLVEGNIDENEKRSFVLDKSDRNSKEPKGNNLHELKSENTLEEKEIENEKKQNSNALISDEVKVLPLSTKVSDLMIVNPDLIEKLESAFREIESLNQAEDLIKKIKECKYNPVEFLDTYDMKTLYHEIFKNDQEWKNFTDHLQNEFDCVICSNEYFTKTYLCYTRDNIDLISSEITDFLNPSPIDFKISPHMMNFVKKFSDLQLDRKSEAEIWIKNISRTRLAELKKEMNKVSCQSYLIDDNQYELLCGEKQELLSDIGKSFHVEGKPYQLNVVGDIPVVFQVDQLTNISCIVNTDPENIPVDSLISVDWKKPSSKSGLTSIEKDKKENTQILDKDSWNLPTNRHIILSMPGMDKRKAPYSWNFYFDRCMKKVLANGISPHTIGISIPSEISEHLVDFCQNVVTALKNFPQNDKRPIYILLFVKTHEMMSNVIEILKKYLVSKSEENFPDTAPEECTVEVIEGLIHHLEVDAVVCSTNKSLDLDGGAVSKALSVAAGPELKRDCAKSFPNGIKFPEIVITKGYKLPCKHVFYGELPGNNKRPNISTFMDSCLKKAAVMGLSSIAFPLLGTGNLMYGIEEAAEQMACAIRQFKDKTLKNSLKKIIIIIYAGSKEKNDLILLENILKTKDSKGAIPKKKTRMPVQNEEKQDIKLIYSQLQWIPFFNFSTKRETLDDVIVELERGLKNDVFPVSADELEDLFFYYDLIDLVPDIVQQMKLKQNSIWVPKDSSKKFEKYLTELRHQSKKAVFHIPKDIDTSSIEYYLIKLRQDYPKVKCAITNRNQDVLFTAPDFNQVEEAKYRFEYMLGLRENISFSSDRFNTNEQQESYEFDKAITHASSAPKPQRSGAQVSYSQKNKDINCFFIENGLLVRVYNGNILDAKVEGIVNAANKWLHHAGGVARAIINAAGDSVNSEGRRKLQGWRLDDGQVLSTSAGNLKKYKYIIHAVGPVYASGLDAYCENKIAETVHNSLVEANKLSLASVALPGISSAIFGVPLGICTKGYLLGVKKFAEQMPQNCILKEVHFVDQNISTIKAIEECFAKDLSAYPVESGENTLQSNDNQRKPENLTENRDKECPVCLDAMSHPKLLPCQHSYCSECVEKLSQPICPVCRLPFGIIRGNQPKGEMIIDEGNFSLPGFNQTKTHIIKYRMGGFWKMKREAYLPKNKKGDVILKMLQLAFKQRLIFTVGESRTTGAQNAITWNEIHHKTMREGGPVNYGYPDPDYFDRVTRELADKGITPDLVAHASIEKYIRV